MSASNDGWNAVSETTGLIPAETTPPKNHGCTTQEESSQQRRRFDRQCKLLTMGIVVGCLFVVCGGILVFPTRSILGSQNDRRVPVLPSDHRFPKGFVWGVATSSYQIEGAVAEDGRGPSIWDTFCDRNDSTIIDHSSGAVACDHYHRMEEDVLLMKELGVKSYRFSIAWPRIFPDGTGQVNPAGVAFYNRLIDKLLENDIEPWVTLYHWDLPQTLEDRYGGWLDRQIIDDFGDYARTCFAAYGDRVSNWITLNEPWTVVVQGYNDGTKAPGKTDNIAQDVYTVGHNLMLAHARAARIYRDEFQQKEMKGRIGIANSGDYRYPKTATSKGDVDAAERAMQFQFAWFSDPLFFGDYPLVMRERLGERLPSFSAEERVELTGSADFLGLNHYSTLYASTNEKVPTFGGYWADMDVSFSSDPSWRKNFMGWSTNPNGCRDLLLWIAERYAGVEIFMTENGTSEDEPDLAASLRDEGRREYMEGYLRACSEAIQRGVKLSGYFAWSLMDNFEWSYGYTKRFGLVHVNFETLQRTPKSSGLWYKETIRLHGSNLDNSKPNSFDPQQSSSGSTL